VEEPFARVEYEGVLKTDARIVRAKLLARDACLRGS